MRFAYLESLQREIFRRRLRMINEETSVQQMPRRRSNSLPIPKIEVSIYQSPESKKKDVSKDFMEVPAVRDDALLLVGMWKCIYYPKRIFLLELRTLCFCFTYDRSGC